MSRSRVSTLMIDCRHDAFDDALAFWTGALGLRPKRAPRAGQRYVTLGRIDGPLYIRLQRVEGESGYHLDIETDSIPDEVARMEVLGARRKYRIRRWWVMEDPAGNAFCVVRPESPEFSECADEVGHAK